MNIYFPNHTDDWTEAFRSRKDVLRARMEWRRRREPRRSRVGDRHRLPARHAVPDRQRQHRRLPDLLRPHDRQHYLLLRHSRRRLSRLRDRDDVPLQEHLNRVQRRCLHVPPRWVQRHSRCQFRNVSKCSGQLLDMLSIWTHQSCPAKLPLYSSAMSAAAVGMSILKRY